MEARAAEVEELRKADKDTDAMRAHYAAVAKKQEEQLQVRSQKQDELQDHVCYRRKRHVLADRIRPQSIYIFCCVTRVCPLCRPCSQR